MMVSADKLPRTFEIATTFHEPATACAYRYGEGVRVHCLGHTIDLRPDQRVMVKS